MTEPRWLEHASRQSSEHPWTLGAVLDEYCRTEGVDRERLATILGCSLESLEWLSLCRKPDPERFAEDVTRIAERFQIEAPKLARVIRRVEAVAALRRATHAEHEGQMLLAARDRDKETGR